MRSEGGKAMDAEHEPEMYTFYDYVCDHELLKNKDTYMAHSMALWDIHGNDYLKYCDDNCLEYERLKQEDN